MSEFFKEVKRIREIDDGVYSLAFQDGGHGSMLTFDVTNADSIIIVYGRYIPPIVEKGKQYLKSTI